MWWQDPPSARSTTTDRPGKVNQTGTETAKSTTHKIFGAGRLHASSEKTDNSWKTTNGPELAFISHRGSLTLFSTKSRPVFFKFIFCAPQVEPVQSYGDLDSQLSCPCPSHGPDQLFFFQPSPCNRACHDYKSQVFSRARLFTPLSQGEAFTLASVSYLAILVKYIPANEKKKEKFLTLFQEAFLYVYTEPPHANRCSLGFFPSQIPNLGCLKEKKKSLHTKKEKSAQILPKAELEYSDDNMHVSPPRSFHPSLEAQVQIRIKDCMNCHAQPWPTLLNQILTDVLFNLRWKQSYSPSCNRESTNQKTMLFNNIQHRNMYKNEFLRKG